MNISFLSPKFASPANTYTNRVNNSDKNSQLVVPKLAPLKQDTVSFSGRGRLVTSIADHLEAQVAAEAERFSRIATTYLDILESVAVKLKDKGFSFDRAYCELNPVKSPKSYRSKVERSSSFKVPDTIRATLYCNDPYDLSKLNDLLSEMQKRGYIVSPTEMTMKDLLKRGYIPTEEEAKLPLEEFEKVIKVVPDLDVRLEDVGEQILKLPTAYKYSIGKPQKSGYEDIQIRFIRNYDTKRTPVQHELIILFGPNYAQAKHRESEFVYSHLREFGNLNISKFLDNEKNADTSKRTNLYISLIQKMFRGKVSEKEFLNGKNMDYAGISTPISITFSKEDEALIDTYFKEVSDSINKIYEKQLSRANKSRRRHIERNMHEDNENLAKIKKELKSTIKYYKAEPDKKVKPKK